MKVFLSATYIDLIEHRKAAHDVTKPSTNETTNARMGVWHSSIREKFVDGLFTAGNAGGD